ncbi:sugar-binding transcriptional regulator [soil metagenome]
MARKPESEITRLDDAARAGWLYYIAGNTQDEIAGKLGISRQTAQRLVSLAVSARLIKVRLDHPISACMELADRLKEKFELAFCEVVPTDPAAVSSTLGIAEACAGEIERRLSGAAPVVLAMGSGRTLRAAVEQLPTMDCPQHKLVSLVGNIATDGSASFYDVIVRMADAVRAPHYPMPVPVIASTRQERDLLREQKPVSNVIALARKAHIAFVGVAQIDEHAPLLLDGFVTRDEIRALRKSGAIGEIVGWAYDQNGELIRGLTNDRVASVEIGHTARRPIIGVSMGDAKVAAISAALRGKLIDGLITSERTAGQLLKR